MTSLLVHCCLGHKRTVPDLFNKTLYHHMGPKRLRSGIQRMFRTSLPKRNESRLRTLTLRIKLQYTLTHAVEVRCYATGKYFLKVFASLSVFIQGHQYLLLQLRVVITMK